MNVLTSVMIEGLKKTLDGIEPSLRGVQELERILLDELEKRVKQVQPTLDSEVKKLFETYQQDVQAHLNS